MTKRAARLTKVDRLPKLATNRWRTEPATRGAVTRQPQAVRHVNSRRAADCPPAAHSMLVLQSGPASRFARLWLSSRLTLPDNSSRASDDCLLTNETGGHIYLTSLDPPSDKHYLEPFKQHTVSPGLWRISVGDSGDVRRHLADILLVRRQFVVDIAEASRDVRRSSSAPT